MAFVAKENEMLREQMRILRVDEADDDTEVRIKYDSTIERIKEKVKQKLVGYIAEIEDLVNEKRILLNELDATHCNLRMVCRKLNEEPKELLDKYQNSLRRMNDHYKEQILSAALIVQQYQEKVEALTRISKAKDGTIEDITGRLNELIESLSETGENDRCASLSKNYKELERRQDLLLKAYEVLANRFEDIGEELTRYKDLYGNDKDHVLQISQDSVVEKDNQLELLRLEVGRLRRDRQNKDRLIARGLKAQFDKENVDSTKKVKVIVYNVNEEAN
ncbi:DEKNAAC102693 [Brettanomyces naardenensis]|uniref:DEKNAAC102693 n=1 Tax=Brettanomyces naardenensis TaxID=13370 RepID=A0A448YLE3_BRENA|nr:DEKNAAC102693 [Brettanomyces naardenensis]